MLGCGSERRVRVLLYVFADSEACFRSEEPQGAERVTGVARAGRDGVWVTVSLQ